MEYWLWNHSHGIIAVDSWPWNPNCGILAVQSLLWNRGCGILKDLNTFGRDLGAPDDLGGIRELTALKTTRFISTYAATEHLV